MKTELTLYQLESCPFCALVRKKLDELKLPFRLVPVEKKGEDREDVISLSGQKAVPVLKDGDKVITDSKKILSYLDQTYSDGNNANTKANDYGLHITMRGDFQSVRQKTIDAFKVEKFGLISEINVTHTMKEKLDLDIEPNSILGFCNPQFAHKGMTEEPDLGLLLPCNVVVREVSPEQYRVSAVSPVKLFSVVGRSDMIDMALEVKGKIQKALDSLAA